MEEIDGDPLQWIVYFVLTDTLYNILRFESRPNSNHGVFLERGMFDLSRVCFEAIKLGSRSHIFCFNVQFSE